MNAHSHLIELQKRLQSSDTTSSQQNLILLSPLIKAVNNIAELNEEQIALLIEEVQYCAKYPTGSIQREALRIATWINSCR